MECAPAFNYARSIHKLEFQLDGSADPATDLPPSPNSNPSISTPSTTKALFLSPDAKLNLELRYVPESLTEDVPRPQVQLKALDLRTKGHLGLSAYADMELEVGQSVW